MHVDAVRGLPGLFSFGTVDGAETPRWTNQTDETKNFSLESEHHRIELVDGAIVTLLSNLTGVLSSNEVEIAHSPPPAERNKEEGNKESRIKEAQLSESSDQDNITKTLPRLTSVPLPDWASYVLKKNEQKPALYTSPERGSPVRIFPINRVPTLTPLDLEAPKLNNATPTVASPSLSLRSDEDIASEDLFQGPDEVSLDLSSENALSVRARSVARQDGSTVVLHEADEFSLVPSPTNGVHQKDTATEFPQKPISAGPPPTLFSDAYPPHDSLGPSLMARLPSLHAKNEDAHGKGSSQDLKNAEVPLPHNLSPQLHSALKKYGRVVSAHALALREYALHLLHQGVSVDEVVKTLHSVLKDKSFLDGKEYSASLRALVQKLKGALKYTSAEGNTFPRLNSAVPAHFFIPGALRYDAVSKEGNTIPVAVHADISPYIDEDVSLSSGTSLIASESTPHLSRVLLTDKDVPSAGAGVREESHETSGTLTQEDVPFVQHDQLNLSLPSAVIAGEKHSIQPGPSLDSARVQQVDLSFSPFHRITEHITRFMESRQAKTIQVQLEPPELGSVLLSVHAVGNRIDAEILASNPDVRQYLETHREQIAAALQSRGLELASFTVSDHGRQGGLFDSIPSRVGSWSAPIPINETPRLSSSALLLTTGLDLKA